jgi:hypothetical protein
VLASRELNSSGERLGALSMLYRQRLWRFVDAYRLALADAPRRRAAGR